MPKIAYQTFNFRGNSLALIQKANEIIAEYTRQGFVLTLRQLYYQFVSRDIIANSMKEYKRLGSVINDGRLAGLIDWNALEDRTRNVKSNGHWSSPQNIVKACVNAYAIDKWEDQPIRPEVWIEKDALVGVIEGVCEELDVPYFSCRGYTSQSEMWAAAMRFIKHGKTAHIIHLGDHDPSGQDMSRDIEERIRMFMRRHSRTQGFEFTRIALNMDQVEQYNPPPNPAKSSDTRFETYRAEHGDESWELDALEPSVLANLIREQVATLRDLYAEAEERERSEREELEKVSDNWDSVIEYVNNEL
jgi:hypothetical protein